MMALSGRHFVLGTLAALAVVCLLAPESYLPVSVAAEDFEGVDLGDGFDIGDEFMENEDLFEEDETPMGDDAAVPTMPSPTTPTSVKTVPPVPYSRPSTTGLNFAELFEDDWLDRWTKSTMPKFSGQWDRIRRETEAILGDYGLRVMDKAKHHAVAARFPKIVSTKDTGLVVSYEAKFEEGLTCGGAYLKVFDSKGMDMKTFDNETPYVIMFGPDRCGATNKVHLIIKSQNPISKEWSEHHLVSPPTVPAGKDTHLYTLRITSQDEYEVLIDGVSKKKGSMHTDFEPPFTPPEEVDDPNDSKPSDWVDEPQIDDPEAQKPDDWDEDAPKMISDPDAQMPDGWLEDEPTEIQDPEATKPEDWDDEEDGEWSAPLVPNPACTVGCGPWTAPTIKNPDYKGPWTPPKVDNPNYKGPWEPRKIPNPNYFKDEHPHELSGTAIDAVGFELWTMDSGLLFDNIVVSQNWDAANKFFDATFKIRQEIERSKQAEIAKASEVVSDMPQGLMGWLYIMAIERPLVAASASFLSILSLIWIVLRVFKRGDKVEKASDKKVDSDKKKDEAETKPTKTTKAKGSDEDESGEEETKAKAKKMKGESEETPTARKRGGRPAPAD